MLGGQHGGEADSADFYCELRLECPLFQQKTALKTGHFNVIRISVESCIPVAPFELFLAYFHSFLTRVCELCHSWRRVWGCMRCSRTHRSGCTRRCGRGLHRSTTMQTEVIGLHALQAVYLMYVAAYASRNEFTLIVQEINGPMVLYQKRKLRSVSQPPARPSTLQMAF